jgi:hypothetical protein
MTIGQTGNSVATLHWLGRRTIYSYAIGVLSTLGAVKDLMNFLPDEEFQISYVDFCRFGDMPALAFYSKILAPDQLLIKRIMYLAARL